MTALYKNYNGNMIVNNLSISFTSLQPGINISVLAYCALKPSILMVNNSLFTVNLNGAATCILVLVNTSTISSVLLNHSTFTGNRTSSDTTTGLMLGNGTAPLLMNDSNVYMPITYSKLTSGVVTHINASWNWQTSPVVLTVTVCGTMTINLIGSVASVDDGAGLGNMAALAGVDANMSTIDATNLPDGATGFNTSLFLE